MSISCKMINTHYTPRSFTPITTANTPEDDYDDLSHLLIFLKVT